MDERRAHGREGRRRRGRRRRRRREESWECVCGIRGRQ
jgi:hypothetical protein